MNYSSDTKTEIRAVFTTTEKTITTDSITQYDKGLVLRFNIPEGTGLFDLTPVVQYSNKASTETINVVAKAAGGEYTADIPNDLTAEKHDIRAVVYIGTGDTAAAAAMAIIPVIPRTKPADYTYQNNISNDDLVEIKNSMAAQLDANTALTEATKKRMDQLDAADRSGARRAFLNDIGTDGLLLSKPLTEPGLYLCVMECTRDVSTGTVYPDTHYITSYRYIYTAFVFVSETVFTDLMQPQNQPSADTEGDIFVDPESKICIPRDIGVRVTPSVHVDETARFDLAKSNDEINIRLKDPGALGYKFTHCYLLAKM